MLLFDLRNNELTGVTSAGPPEVFTKVQQVYLQQQRTASNEPTYAQSNFKLETIVELLFSLFENHFVNNSTIFVSKSQEISESRRC